jgi:hypothetical protein
MHHWAETRWKIKENQRNKMISLSLSRSFSQSLSPCAPCVCGGGGDGASQRWFGRKKARLAAREIISTLNSRLRIKRSDDRRY